MAACTVCFRHCVLRDGATGDCGARRAEGGRVVPLYYGTISSLSLDPVEKKPLRHFHPGSLILSAGSLGCNLHCPFCQNHEISQPDSGKGFRIRTKQVSPGELALLAEECRPEGNIGLAFTYNEPLVSYEFVRDTVKLVHSRGMACVLVTNGTASLPILEELIPYIDAMNIDLKGFTDRYYSRVLKGDLATVKAFIAEAVRHCHVELTTLIVPGENDSEEEMEALSAWIASLSGVQGAPNGRSIPLHISRFFPRYQMTDRPPTDVRTVKALADVARQHLDHVYTGNC